MRAERREKVLLIVKEEALGSNGGLNVITGEGFIGDFEHESMLPRVFIQLPVDGNCCRRSRHLMWSVFRGGQSLLRQARDTQIWRRS